MKRQYIFTLFITFHIFTISYIYSQNSSEKFNDDTLIYISKIWEKDSMACEGLRDKYWLYLERNFKIKNYSIFDIYEIFGKPDGIYALNVNFTNETNKITSKIIIKLRYNTKIYCEVNKLSSYIEFWFDFRGNGYSIVHEHFQ